MAELKRKREEDAPEAEEPGTVDATCAAPTSSPVAAPLSPPAESGAPATAAAAAAEPNAAVERAAAPDATLNVSEVSGAAAEGGEAVKAAAAAPSPSPRAPKQKKRHEPPPAAKIMICGKEITVKHTGGRKKRKHPIETLIILAYKGQLALACKANNMVSALEIYREMKTKGVTQDLSVRVVGGWLSSSYRGKACKACNAAAADLVARNTHALLRSANMNSD